MNDYAAKILLKVFVQRHWKHPKDEDDVLRAYRHAILNSYYQSKWDIMSELFDEYVKYERWIDGGPAS